jgi:hypothetical protein
MKLGFKIRLVHLLAGVLCVFLVLLLVAIVFWSQPQASGLAIAFVGYTNVFGQPRSAVFGVTNLSRRRINFVVVPEPQIRTEGVWSEVAITGPLPMSGLPGGQGKNVTSALPSRGKAWRMPIIWGHDISTAERYVHRVKNLLRAGGSLSGWKYGFALPCYTNFSAEMELPKAEPDGAASRSQPVPSDTNLTSAAAGSGR